MWHLEMFGLRLVRAGNPVSSVTSSSASPNTTNAVSGNADIPLRMAELILDTLEAERAAGNEVDNLCGCRVGSNFWGSSIFAWRFFGAECLE